MFGSSLVILSALVLIAIMSIYFPTIFIRKTNAILKVLQEIAANGKK